jgi:hypothetical protein
MCKASFWLQLLCFERATLTTVASVSRHKKQHSDHSTSAAEVALLPHAPDIRCYLMAETDKSNCLVTCPNKSAMQKLPLLAVQHSSTATSKPLKNTPTLSRKRKQLVERPPAGASLPLLCCPPPQHASKACKTRAGAPAISNRIIGVERDATCQRGWFWTTASRQRRGQPAGCMQTQERPDTCMGRVCAWEFWARRSSAAPTSGGWRCGERVAEVGSRGAWVREARTGDPETGTSRGEVVTREKHNAQSTRDARYLDCGAARRAQAGSLAEECQVNNGYLIALIQSRGLVSWVLLLSSNPCRLPIGLVLGQACPSGPRYARGKSSPRQQRQAVPFHGHGAGFSRLAAALGDTLRVLSKRRGRALELRVVA